MESRDPAELRRGTEYEVQTSHYFRGQFVGIEKVGNSEVVVFKSGGVDKHGKANLRKVPRANFVRAAD